MPRKGHIAHGAIRRQANAIPIVIVAHRRGAEVSSGKNISFGPGDSRLGAGFLRVGRGSCLGFQDGECSTEAPDALAFTLLVEHTCVATRVRSRGYFVGTKAAGFTKFAVATGTRGTWFGGWAGACRDGALSSD